MRRALLLAIALLLCASGTSAQRGAFTLEDESCGGGVGALTARIESPGHTSAETICYLDLDESQTFTPSDDLVFFVSHDNETTGCDACPSATP